MPYKNALERKANQKQYRIKNKLKLATRSKAYYVKNKQALTRYKKEWYAKNKKRVLPRARENFFKNLDKNRLYRRRYSKSNRDVLNKAFRKYQRNPANSQKHKSRTTLLNAIKLGVVKRPSACSGCGKRCKPEAHHYKGYEPRYALDVMWLCKHCHEKQHAISIYGL